jgi:tetraacyldisaccharide 4'-kinase
MDILRGSLVRAVCSLGNPDAFFATLESLGAVIDERLAYPDHSILPADALKSKHIVVTTEKDAIRLKSAEENVFALGIKLRDFAHN